MPKVPLQSLTFAKLGDGFNGRTIDEALQKIHDDLLDRGQDPRKRELTIKVTFTPDLKDRIDIDTEYTIKLPSLRPPGTKARLDAAAGGFVFNPDMADNPEQRTLADVGEE